MPEIIRFGTILKNNLVNLILLITRGRTVNVLPQKFGEKCRTNVRTLTLGSLYRPSYIQRDLA